MNVPVEVNVKPPLPFIRQGEIEVCLPKELDTFNQDQKNLVTYMIILGAQSASSYAKMSGFVVGVAVSFSLFWLASNGWAL